MDNLDATSVLDEVIEAFVEAGDTFFFALEEFVDAVQDESYADGWRDALDNVEVGEPPFIACDPHCTICYPLEADDPCGDPECDICASAPVSSVTDRVREYIGEYDSDRVTVLEEDVSALSETVDSDAIYVEALANRLAEIDQRLDHVEQILWGTPAA